MILYSYKCNDCHQVFDAFASLSDRNKPVICECDGVANKITTPVRFKLDGTDDGFPTAHDRWAKVHQASGTSQD